ncbi:hypothetical protein BDN70DRAFT_880553 [Pholiota conissans]|uniref:Uncharacterized protein n=1 Tax=Pholiota conissans TaxID=109636 RepID=A0A9P6CYY8_9AGAR|nr:hypothetical protein BDN70DRAFT_880553 [Pholiota conissans]
MRCTRRDLFNSCPNAVKQFTETLTASSQGRRRRSIAPMDGLPGPPGPVPGANDCIVFLITGVRRKDGSILIGCHVPSPIFHPFPPLPQHSHRNPYPSHRAQISNDKITMSNTLSRAQRIPQMSPQAALRTVRPIGELLQRQSLGNESSIADEGARGPRVRPSVLGRAVLAPRRRPWL